MDYAKVLSDYRAIKKELAPEWLVRFRGARSYAQAAKELGCHRSYYWKCEKGVKELSDTLIAKLVKELHV